MIERRSAEGRLERLPDLAAELVRLKVDVIVAASGNAVRAVKQATTTIPIVMAPGAVDLVTSLARPGGNLTGLNATVDDRIDGKRLELLKEVLPRMARVGVIAQTPRAGRPLAIAWKELIDDAQALQVALVFATADQADQYPDAFATLARAQVDAVMLAEVPLAFANGPRIAELAVKHRLATMSAFRETVEAGGLVAYGASISDIIRRAAGYVDKILKGANPGDLPIEQPTKFDLVINLKTAKALGLTIPPAVLARADEVIQ